MLVSKNALRFFSFLLLLGLLAVPLVSHARLELNYPKIPGIESVPTSESPLAQYLAYLYYLVVDIVGVIAFVILIVGGIQHLTSAGSVDKAKAARHRIIGGGAGLLIVLGAFMTLRTINPQLVGLEPIKPIPLHGICLYAQRGTDEEEMHCFQENTPNVLPEDFQAEEIEIEAPRSEWQTVFLFPEKDYQESFVKLENPLLFRPAAGESRPILGLSFSPRSLYFDNHEYGIYLFPHEGGMYTEETFQDFPKNLPVVLNSPITDLENFNDRTRSLYLHYTYEDWSQQVAIGLADDFSFGDVDPGLFYFGDFDFGDFDLGDLSFTTGVGGPTPGFGDLSFANLDDVVSLFGLPHLPDHCWGTILHTSTNGEGRCGIVYPSGLGTNNIRNRLVPTLSDIDLQPIVEPIDRVRSVDIFNLYLNYEDDLQGSVTFCEKPNFEGHCHTISASEIGNTIWHETFDYPWHEIEEKIYSVRIEGSFWAVMTDAEDFDGRCQVFTDSPADLKSEYVLSSTESLLSTAIHSIAIIPVVPAEEI